MLTYNKVLFHLSSFVSIRMVIGAISVIYMLHSGVGLADIAYIKAMQAMILIAFSIIVANFMDKLNRKYFYLLAILSSSCWLFIFFIGGFYKMIFYFYIAEIFNAISLVIYNNLYNAYLLDQYVKDTKTKNFEIVLGSYSKYSFMGMAFCAAVGAVFYNYLTMYLFLISSFLMILLLIIGIIYLPNQYGVSSKKGELRFNTKDVLLVVRKIKQLALFIVPLILITIFYQLIIQYWQIIAASIQFISKNSYMYGIIFIASLYIQSLAGKVAKRVKAKTFIMSFIFMLIGLLCIYLALTSENIYFLIVGLSVLFFTIRINIIFTNIYSHKNITRHIRSRFDSYINTASSIFTGIFLLINGYFIGKFGIITLVYISSTLVLLAFLFFIIIRRFNKSTKR